MNVTFFDHQPYYPKAKIQGENMREYQLWDTALEPAIDHLLQPSQIALEPTILWPSQIAQPISLQPETQILSSNSENSENHPPTSPTPNPD